MKNLAESNPAVVAYAEKRAKIFFLILLGDAVYIALSVSIFAIFFFNLLTLLRLSMAKSKMSLGKGHIALEDMWVIFKYLLILISNIIPQW